MRLKGLATVCSMLRTPELCQTLPACRHCRLESTHVVLVWTSGSGTPSAIADRAETSR